MKKALSLVLSLIVAVCLLFSLSISVTAANVVEQDGLVLTISTNKDVYAEDEEILLSIKVENKNTYPVTGVSLETLLPEGLNIKDTNTDLTNITIPTGEAFQAEVIVTGIQLPTEAPTEAPTGAPVQKPNGIDNPQTGDENNIMVLVTLLIALLVSAVLIVKKKKGMQTMCLILCAVLMISMLPIDSMANPVEDMVTITAEKTIAVGDQSYTLQAKLSYFKPTTAVYVVTFETSGGSQVAPQMVNEGACAQLPAIPEREQFLFRGWYTDDVTFANAYDFATPVTENITLYAKWIPVESNVATGTDDSVSIFSISTLNVDRETGSVTATVSAPENCALLVRFVEEEVFFSDNYNTNKSYINNGELFASHVVAAGSKMAQITTTVNGSLPENFVAEAILLDETGAAVSEPYSSVVNTERYEVFDNKVINDFAPTDVVLNFDESQQDNFGVLADDVKVITADDVWMEDVDGDGEEDIYKIKNPSEPINSQDKIFISDSNDYFIFKAYSIADEQGVIVAEPTNANDSEYGFNLLDFYKFLKVDIAVGEDSEVEPEAEPEPMPATTYGMRSWWNPTVFYVNENIGASTNLALSPLDIETDHFKATAKVSGKLSANLILECDIHVFSSYLRCDFTYTADTTASLEVMAKIEDNLPEPDVSNKELNFGKVRIPFGVTGFSAFADIKACVEWEIDAGLYAEVTSKNTSGFTYNTRDGFRKVERKENNWKIECKGHAELKFGPKPSIGVQFLDGVLSCELECFFGGVAEADVVVPVFQGGDSKHACYLCVKGNIRAEISVNAKLEYNFVVTEGTPIDWNIITFNAPICDFYLSLHNDSQSPFGGDVRGGLGDCPNCSYKTVIRTEDAAGQSVTTEVLIYKKDDNTLVNTITSGQDCYLYEGTYLAKVSIDSVNYEKEFTVVDGAKNVLIKAESVQGQINGTVLDIVDNSGISNATIKVYEHSTCVAVCTTDANGRYAISLDQGTYKIEVTKDGYVSVNQQFTIRDGENKHLEAMLLAKEDNHRIMGGIFGVIKDGLTGQPVQDVKIQIREGWGNESINEPCVAELNTDGNGEYAKKKGTVHGVDFGLDAGNYTVTISKDGYVTTSFNVTVVGGENLEFNSTITPVGDEDVWHIVLTWGEYPSDLDSHLNATYDETQDHIYYSDKVGYAADLDVDDVTSYGPETITIEDAAMYTGNMFYSVHDFSNRYNGASTKMALSGATVKVYRGGALLEVFHVPTSGVGTVWNVFYINEEGNVCAVNSFEHIESPSEVCGRVN